MPTIRVEKQFKGLKDRGQGGYTAGRLAEYFDGPVTVALLAPPPLDVDMDVTEDGTALLLTHGDTVIARAERDTRPYRELEPVNLIAAENATRRFPGKFHHAAPGCFSCGIEPGSFGVHVGPTAPQGPYASPWIPPAWTAPHGIVEDPIIWAASDCAAGWRAINEPEPRSAVTAWIRTDLLAPILPDRTYVIASWSDPWDGRKCQAGSGIFTPSGAMVARSESLWVSVDKDIT